MNHSLIIIAFVFIQFKFTNYPLLNYIEHQNLISIENIPPGYVFVEGGSFTMGCTADQEDECRDDEMPPRTISVNSFFMQEHEVTNGEYIEFLNSKGNQEEGGAQWYKIESSYARIKVKDNHYFVEEGYELHPLNEVSWFGAVAYAQWLSEKEGKLYRLPTEAEWEFAARGGVHMEGYKYSGGNVLADLAWTFDNSEGDTKVVMTKNQNALGIYDMSGSVFEWCSDYYAADYYAQSANANNPKGPEEGKKRVLRGGSWIYSGPKKCRVSHRDYFYPFRRNCIHGFRLVSST